MMIQQVKLEDYVIATGRQISVREFVLHAAEQTGITITISGSGTEEVGIVTAIDEEEAPGIKLGDVIVKVDPHYYRPAEVEELLGDPAKAKKQLAWVPEISIEDMIAQMMTKDMEKARQNALLLSHGHKVNVTKE